MQVSNRVYDRSPEQMPPPERPVADAVVDAARDPPVPAPEPVRDDHWLSAHVLEELAPYLRTDDLLARLLPLSGNLFPHDAGLVATVQPGESPSLKIARTFGLNGAAAALPERIALARLIHPWALADGPLHVPDLAASPLQVAGFLTDQGMRSLLGIPIAASDDGATAVLLVLAARRVGAFGHIGAATLARFRRALTIPLRNARHMEAHQRQSHELLTQATRLWDVVGTATSPVAGLARLLDAALPIAEADAGTFMMSVPESQEVYVRASRGMRTRTSADRQLPWGSRAGRALQALHAPLSIRPLLPPGEPPAIPAAAAEGFQTYLGLPLYAVGAPEVVGLLNLYWRRDVPDLSADTLEVLESLTYAAAVLLEHSALRARNATCDRLIAQLQAHKAQTASLVGHQLRTPITAIGGFAQLLVRRAPAADSPVSRYATIIQTECRRLGVLIDNVLELSRLEESLLVMQLRAFDLAALLKDLHADPLLRGHFPADALVWDLQEPVPIVIGDPLRLKQALLALLLRLAAPATAGAGPPVLAVRAVDAAGAPVVEIAVEAGVSGPRGANVEELLATVDLRQAVDNPDARADELALYAALQLLRAMGAGVRTAQGAGGGARYVVSLPVLEET